VQALVREALAGGRRRGGLFDLNDHGGNSRPFGRGARTNPVVQRRRDINTGNKLTVMATLHRHLRYDLSDR